MLVQESYTNATEGYRYGDSEPYECGNDPGEIFRIMQKEYGRCTSSVYVDTENGTKRVGWVFTSRQQYEDTGDTYIREVWVTLYDKPERIVKHYHEL